MDFDMFSKIKAKESNNNLRLRGLKVTGNKPVLAARAFSPFENNVAVIKTADEVEADFKQEYDGKLKLHEMNVPDPFKLNNGWLDEGEGIAYWPIVPTYYIKIQFLMIDSDVEDLSDYKGPKAYSYFKQVWLSNISYHSLG